MTHVRQQIRDKIETTIKGLKTTGNRVYSSRFYNLNDADLPALRIKTKEEDTELLCKWPRYVQHSLPVEIECVARQGTNVDNLIDTITNEVETALMVDPTLGGLAKRTTLITSTDIEFDTEQQQPLAIATLLFTVIYITIDGAPETAI